MSGRGRYRGNRNHKPHAHTLSSVARENALSLPADSPVLSMFKSVATLLNKRHDLHEKLVKLSRDITIESKRIIFLLHSAITKEAAGKAIAEANERLKALTQGPIKNIGLELEHSPAFLHSKAVTSGLQEFIEARTFCSLMENGVIITWGEVQQEFVYKIKDEETEREVVTMLPYVDYMLGLADLTGELMRKAINSISSGDSDECFQSCQNVRHLYTGFLSLFGAGKELARKLNVTRNNVSKVELAVYALRVRGGEAPPTLLLQPPPQHGEWDDPCNNSDDEGYY